MAQQSGGKAGTAATPAPEAADRESPDARLDRLEQRVAELARSVETGLVAQARRVESVVGTTRHELVEAMRDHSEVVEATTRAVREAVAESAPPTPEGSVPVGNDADVVEDLRDELQQDRLTLREGLRRDVEDLRERLSQDVHSVREQVQSLVEQAVPRPDDTDEDGTRDRVRQLVDEVAGGLTAAERRLGATLDSLREVQESLVAHLVDRDRQVALERAHLTRAFVEELAGALSKRDRRRVARRLDVDRMATSDWWDRTDEVPPSRPAGEAGGAPANVPVVRPATGPPPGTADPAEPDSEPEREPESEPEREPESEPATEPHVDVAAAPESPTDARSRVRPSLGTRPVHDRSSTPRDPAAMRRTLAAVRGLGPARQAALVSAFGSLEELREATDEELLAVRGIGPSLLEPIRSVL